MLFCRECPLYSQERICAAHKLMTALGDGDAPLPHCGTRIVVPLKSIVSAAAGAAFIEGTHAASNAGASPGEPPRGFVRTTWLGGSAMPSFSFAYIAFMASKK